VGTFGGDKGGVFHGDDERWKVLGMMTRKKDAIRFLNRENWNFTSKILGVKWKYD